MQEPATGSGIRAPGRLVAVSRTAAFGASWPFSGLETRANSAGAGLFRPKALSNAWASIARSRRSADSSTARRRVSLNGLSRLLVPAIVPVLPVLAGKAVVQPREATVEPRRVSRYVPLMPTAPITLGNFCKSNIANRATELPPSGSRLTKRNSPCFTNSDQTLLGPARREPQSAGLKLAQD
jgi:hypothetical protein